jgi:hypothetical protein
MIFSQKIFRLMHKIALFAILFASFAPTISHALVERGNTNSFFFSKFVVLVDRRFL